MELGSVMNVGIPVIKGKLGGGSKDSVAGRALSIVDVYSCLVYSRCGSNTQYYLWSS